MVETGTAVRIDQLSAGKRRSKVRYGVPPSVTVPEVTVFPSLSANRSVGADQAMGKEPRQTMLRPSPSTTASDASFGKSSEATRSERRSA